MDTPTNMRALLCDGPHKYYVKEIPVDYITEKSLKPNELLVKILLVGICGSDIKMYKGAPFYWADNGRVNKKLLPIISGHEFVGEVVDPGTTDFKVGELVVTEQLVVCQSLNRPPCWFCQNGHFNKCDNLSIYGQAMHGALSEYMVYRDARLTYRATGLTANQAVLTEVLAVSVHSVQRVIPHLNDDTLKGMTAVVSGCGSVGLGVIAGLRHLIKDRPLTIIGLDVHDYKLEYAKKIGADYVFNVSPFLNEPETVCAKVKELVGKDNIFTIRNGTDLFFECSGSHHSIPQGFHILRKKAIFAHVGIQPNDLITRCPWNFVSAGKELIIVGASLGHGAWDTALDILRTGVLDSIVTHKYSLEDFEEAFHMVDDGSKSVKVVIDPTIKPTQKLQEKFSEKKYHTEKTEEKYYTEKTEEKSHVQPVTLKPGVGILSGKLAVITGSSRGLGKEIAKQLCSLGAYVTIHGTSENSPSYLGEGTTMTDLAKEISEKNGNSTVFSVVGDLTEYNSTVGVFEKISQFWNLPVDILICCSGGNIGTSGVNTDSGGKPANDDCTHMAPEDINKVMAVNLHTTIHSCKAVMPEMEKRKKGVIVTIGSVAGMSGRSGGAMYAVAKAAVHEYTRCLAAQTLGTGIRVNCIAPGPISTERYKRNVSGKLPDLVSTVEEVASAVTLLCRKEGENIHGQVIRVDKGLQLF